MPLKARVFLIFVNSINMISKHRYCLTEEGRVVLDSDVNANSLLVGKGCEISEVDIKRFGFINGELTPKVMPLETKEKPLANNVTDLRDKENSKKK